MVTCQAAVLHQPAKSRSLTPVRAAAGSPSLPGVLHHLHVDPEAGTVRDDVGPVAHHGAVPEPAPRCRPQAG